MAFYARLDKPPQWKAMRGLETELGILYLGTYGWYALLHCCRVICGLVMKGCG